MSRSLMTALAAVLVLAAGAGGFLAGSATDPTAAEIARARTEARAEAASRAEQAAYARTFAQARADGAAEARRKAAARGRAAGRKRGRAVLARRIARAERAGTAAGTRKLEVPPHPLTADEMPLDAAGPAPVNGSCPEPFTYHMGICKISRPARADECPPGWVPAGVTGACAPRD